jgi:hypothetical protein
LLNNPYVQETIRTEVNYANINAFSESPIITPETITGAVTAMAQNANVVNNQVFAPCTVASSPVTVSMTFFDNPQDTFYNYANIGSPWYGDCRITTRIAGIRFNKTKVCRWEFTGGPDLGSTKVTMLQACHCFEFDGAFNSLIINRKAIAQWIGGTYTLKPSVLDPCGNNIGPLYSYQAGITLEPHYGFLGFRVQMYPIEL